jgi:hypothetical protein
MESGAFRIWKLELAESGIWSFRRSLQTHPRIRSKSSEGEQFEIPRTSDSVENSSQTSLLSDNTVKTQLFLTIVGLKLILEVGEI